MFLCKEIIPTLTINKNIIQAFPSLNPGLPQFFVIKPVTFQNVKSGRGGLFSEKTDYARVTHNFQKLSVLVHDNYICWNNHYNVHDATSFLSDYNESALF